jgi:hypothetical protein
MLACWVAGKACALMKLASWMMEPLPDAEVGIIQTLACPMTMPSSNPGLGGRQSPDSGRAARGSPHERTLGTLAMAGLLGPDRPIAADVTMAPESLTTRVGH